MTEPDLSFPRDLSMDPRQFATRKLLDSIAALWHDEKRLRYLTLDFHAADGYWQGTDSVMTCISYTERARDEYAEFKRLWMDEPAPIEYTAEDRAALAEAIYEVTQERVADAQRDCERAARALENARKAAAAELAALGQELDA